MYNKEGWMDQAVLGVLATAFVPMLYLVDFVLSVGYVLQGIESLKKVEASWVRKSRWKSMQAVFGRFSVHWFSPFTADRQSAQGKGHGYLFSV